MFFEEDDLGGEECAEGVGDEDGDVADDGADVLDADPSATHFTLVSELLIESDRFAEDFYLTMGAVRVGAAASPVDGAPLPLLKIKLASEAG